MLWIHHPMEAEKLVVVLGILNSSHFTVKLLFISAFRRDSKYILQEHRPGSKAILAIVLTWLLISCQTLKLNFMSLSLDLK